MKRLNRWFFVKSVFSVGRKAKAGLSFNGERRWRKTSEEDRRSFERDLPNRTNPFDQWPTKLPDLLRWMFLVNYCMLRLTSEEIRFGFLRLNSMRTRRTDGEIIFRCIALLDSKEQRSVRSSDCLPEIDEFDLLEEQSMGPFGSLYSPREVCEALLCLLLPKRSTPVFFLRRWPSSIADEEWTEECFPDRLKRSSSISDEDRTNHSYWSVSPSMAMVERQVIVQSCPSWNSLLLS